MRALLLIAAVMIVCVSGCTGEVSTPPPPAQAFDPKVPAPRPEIAPHHPADRAGLLAQLDAARKHWNAEGPKRYQLTVSRICFCEHGVPFVSTVDGLTVVRSTGGHLKDGGNWGPALRTVELLFWEARQAAMSDADEVQVEFDPRFRYPAQIRIDQWRDAVDDEIAWEARLRVLK
jgi:hypothetical protein